MCSFIYSVPGSALNLTWLLRYPYFLSMTSVLTWMNAWCLKLCLVLFLLKLYLKWDTWPCQHEERPAAIAIRADGIFTTSPFCCSVHIRGFFKRWKNQMFLSFCFLLSSSPPCSSTHAKSQWHWLFLCCSSASLCTSLLASGLHGSPQHCPSSPWILFLWFWVFTDPSRGWWKQLPVAWKLLC